MAPKASNIIDKGKRPSKKITPICNWTMLTIVDRDISGGPTVKGQKKYAEQAYTDELPFRRKQVGKIISFSEDDLVGVHTPHDNVLIIMATRKNLGISRVLVDTGSSADIIFIDTFEKVGYFVKDLTSCNSLLEFNNNVIYPEGILSFPLSLGQEPLNRTVRIDFIVLKAQST